MRRRLVVIGVLVLAIALVFASVATAKPCKPHKMPKGKIWKVYKADLKSLNGSGVTGTAYLYYRKGTVTVSVYASGLEAAQQHPQHIHGFPCNKNSVCPPMSAAGEDGILTLTEGLPFYGPVLMPLDMNGTNFPVPNDAGEIHYLQTFTGKKAISPLHLRTIVLHGMSVGGVYEPTLPVACGDVRRAGNVHCNYPERLIGKGHLK